jgi:hypothetical protein
LPKRATSRGTNGAQNVDGVIGRRAPDREQSDQVEEARSAENAERSVGLQGPERLFDAHAWLCADHVFPTPAEGQDVERESDRDEQQRGPQEDRLQLGRPGGGGERLVGGDAVDLRRDEEGQQHAGESGAQAPRSGELGSLARLLGHGRGQRAVGHIDQRVDQSEDPVGEVGVQQGRSAGQARGHRECQDAKEQQGDRTENDEGPELAPPGHGAVDHPAGEEVGEGVPQSHDEEHGADGGGGKADDIGVIEKQEGGAQGEGEVVGDVPRAIADDGLDREFHGSGRPFRWVVVPSTIAASRYRRQSVAVSCR